MATQNVSLSAEFEAFANEMVATGRFANVREVLEGAKAALLREVEDDDLDIDYVRQALAEADASGIYQGDAFADLRAKHGLASRS